MQFHCTLREVSQSDDESVMSVSGWFYVTRLGYRFCFEIESDSTLELVFLARGYEHYR